MQGCILYDMAYIHVWVNLDTWRKWWRQKDLIIWKYKTGIIQQINKKISWLNAKAIDSIDRIITKMIFVIYNIHALVILIFDERWKIL